jgi:hypothetical protein
MNRNDKHAVRVDPGQRRGWTAPRMRRLMTSDAAFNPAGGADTEGFS